MRIVIVGGVAAGMSAAARARRLDESAEIIVLERGEHVSFATCGLPYYVGGEIGDSSSLLVQTPDSLRAALAIDVRTRHEVTDIDPAARTVTVHSDRGVETLTYDALVLAPGAFLVLDAGGEIVQETRRWDEAKERTVSMRGKEESHDYRYFPDPDLVELRIDEAWKQAVRASIPELPDARRERYVREYGLPAYDADVITASKKLADFFEESLKYTSDAKAVANWIMGDLLGYLNTNRLEFDDVKITGQGLGEMIGLLEKGTISGKIAKTVFREMLETGKRPQQIVEEKGLVQISDEGAIRQIVAAVIEQNPQSVADYKAGKEKAIGFLVGQVMKETKGKANPGLVNQLLRELLNG